MTSAIGAVIVIPLAGAVLATVAGPRATRAIAAATAVATLATAAALAREVARHGTLREAAGGWLAPLGIGLVDDGLATVLLLAIAIVGALVTAYALANPEAPGIRARPWFALWLFAWASLDALVLSSDIFNLYVTLELSTLAAVGLVALGEDRRAVAAALRYLLFALVGSLVYLLGVALLYGLCATLDLGLLAARLGTGAPAWTALALVTAGLAFKAALFPVHAWALSAYDGAPPPASAIVAGLTSKAAFLVLVKLWAATFPARFAHAAGPALGALAAGAILWGSLQALWQQRVGMVIAYSSIAHVGYLFLGFALGARGRAGSVYVAISHAAAVAAAFLVAGAMERAVGHDRIEGLAGLARRLPVAMFALTLAGVSLMGFPPSGGFIGKWLLLRAAVDTGAWWAVAVLLISGLLAAGYVFRLLRGAFLPLPAGERVAEVGLAGQLVALGLAAVAVLLGVCPGGLLDLLAAGPSR